MFQFNEDKMESLSDGCWDKDGEIYLSIEKRVYLDPKIPIINKENTILTKWLEKYLANSVLSYYSYEMGLCRLVVSFLSGESTNMPKLPEDWPHSSYSRNEWKREGEESTRMYTLIDGVKGIMAGNAPKLRFEHLYQAAYSLTLLNKGGAKLYQGVSDELDIQIEAILNDLLKNDTDNIARATVNVWRTFVKHMGIVSDILLYLERTWVETNEETPVKKLGLEKFKQAVVKHPTIEKQLKISSSSRASISSSSSDGEDVDNDLRADCSALLESVSLDC